MPEPLETELEQNVVVCINIGNSWAQKYNSIKKSEKAEKDKKK